MLFEYDLKETEALIGWTYFLHAWNFPSSREFVEKVTKVDADASLSNDKDHEKTIQAISLIKDARELLQELQESGFRTRSLLRLCKAQSQDDDLILDGRRLPLLRQQHPGKDGVCLCLSDFVRPESMGEDTVALFLATSDDSALLEKEKDPYRRLLLETLSDRLAEATAERLHLEVRRSLWGYARDENLETAQILEARYKGIRPAVGYPSLPDQSVNFILDEMLDFSSIGVSLTQSGAMHPHSSVSGLMIGHPESRYFSIGKIGEDQLEDYSRRRGMKVEDMRRFLTQNLTTM